MNVDIQDAIRFAVREELARRRLLDYAQLIYPRFSAPPHIRHMAGLLEKLDAGTVRRICISIPVRHGKSVVCSQIFPSWLVGRHPTTEQIILASHAESLAVTHSRVAKQLVEDERYPFRDVELSADSASVQRWNVTGGAGMYAIGVGGSITGRGATTLIIDDAVHDGLSSGERENAWLWFTEVAVPRLEPGGRIIVIGARFAGDDLVGRIQDSPDASEWAFIRFPAIATEDDILGRRVGQALWPERMPLSELEERRALMSSVAFEAQFQQRPVPREGNTIKREWLRYGDLPAEFERIVLAIDAASKTGIANDWSAIIALGVHKNQFYVLDVVRQKCELPQLRRLTLNMFEKHRPSRVYVEDTSNGVGLIQELRQNTVLPIVPVKPKGAKLARVEGICGLFEAGRVHLPVDASWRAIFEDELLRFPAAPHDDMVDALTIALSRSRTTYDAGVKTWAFARNY